MPETPPMLPTAEGEALLREASPTSLDRLFSLNPELWTEADWLQYVTEVRAQRVRWDRAEAEGKKRAPAAPKPTKAGKIDLNGAEL